MTAIIILAVASIIVFSLYNTLVGKKNQVENAFRSIDTLLEKRFDLIPNLVATVKQYMSHEADVLTEITEMRSKAVSGDDKVAMDNKFSKALGGIMVAVENYPDLKASTNFIQLQQSLNEIEEQLSAARRAFNASVTDYNNAVEMFPTNVMANMMKYQTKSLFEAAEHKRENVDVGNLFDK